MIQHNLCMAQLCVACQLEVVTMPRTPLQRLRGKNISNDLQTCIWATQEHCGHPWLYNSLKNVLIGYTAVSWLVLFGRSCHVSIIIFSRCQFTILCKAAWPLPLHRNINVSPCQHTCYLILEKILLWMSIWFSYTSCADMSLTLIQQGVQQCLVTWKCMPMRIYAHSANLMCDA